MVKLFFLFAVMPIIEIALLVNVGEQIGGWNTVGLVILTAAIGAFIVRQQGVATLLSAQQKMQAGQLPGREMAEGLLLAIAGVLLITPGFVTDAIGFILAMPVTRPLLASALLKRMQVQMVAGAQRQSAYRQPNEKGDVFEGEYQRTDANSDNDRLN